MSEAVDYNFALLDAEGIRVYRSWFDPPSLTPAVSPPDGAWERHITHAPKAKGYQIFAGQELVAVLQTEELSNRGCALALVVAPEWRNRGLGTNILRAFLLAKSARFDSFDAHVEPDNVPSLCCFARAGFKPASEKPDQDGLLTLVYEPAVTA